MDSGSDHAAGDSGGSVSGIPDQERSEKKNFCPDAKIRDC